MFDRQKQISMTKNRVDPYEGRPRQVDESLKGATTPEKIEPSSTGQAEACDEFLARPKDAQRQKRGDKRRNE